MSRALVPQHPSGKTDSGSFGGAGERHEGARCRWNGGSGGTGHGHPRRHDHGRFERFVKDWIVTADEFQRPFTELVYQPMLEVLDFCGSTVSRRSLFSGGGVEVRTFSETSSRHSSRSGRRHSIVTKYEIRHGGARGASAKAGFYDDKEDKPEGISCPLGGVPLQHSATRMAISANALEWVRPARVSRHSAPRRCRARVCL